MYSHLTRVFCLFETVYSILTAFYRSRYGLGISKRGPRDKGTRYRPSKNNWKTMHLEDNRSWGRIMKRDQENDSWTTNGGRLEKREEEDDGSWTVFGRRVREESTERAGRPKDKKDDSDTDNKAWKRIFKRNQDGESHFNRVI